MSKRIEDVRKEFSLDPFCIHLGLAMFTSHPHRVTRAIERHREGFNLNPVSYHQNKGAFEDHILRRAAAYFNTSPEQIILTESTTQGLGIVFAGLQLAEGDEILTTVHEHYAASETLAYKAKRDRLHLKTISLYENPQAITEKEILERLYQAITSRTRLLALTWAHSGTGVKLPIAAIGKAMAEINALRNEEEQILFAVDGLHSLGVENFNVEELQCDFFIAGCHKWIFGPRGTGIVWGSRKGWKRISPLMPSFKQEAFSAWFHRDNPEEKCPRAWLCMPGGFQAYEHRWALGEAFDFHLELGKENVSDKIRELNSYCKAQVALIRGVKLITPTSPSLSGGMVCFEVEKMAPDIVVQKLREKKVFITRTPYRETFCRFSPGILNHQKEIEMALSHLKEITNKGRIL